MHKRILAVFLHILLVATLFAWGALAATLMPPGKIQFFDANGNPLSNGRVYYYIPNTLTPKTTWQDAGQTILNTNPIQLDAGGFAIVYGSGNYRMIVRDSGGNTIYDQLTASTAEVTVDNIQYYSSTVSGAPNAVIVSAITPSDYSLTSGKTLRFIAPFSNTGTTTLNALGLGAKTIKRSTANVGVTTLAGGEIVSGGVYDVLYNGTDYILLNPSLTDNPGEVKPYFGSSAPNGYLLMGGQAISRTTYAPLFAAISTNCGVGDGATTFNVCDLRGRALFGVDDMVTGAANRVTSAGSGVNGAVLAAAGGDQLQQAHTHTGPLHSHTGGAHSHTITDVTHTHGYSNYPTGNANVGSVINVAQTGATTVGQSGSAAVANIVNNTSTGAAFTGITTTNNGGNVLTSNDGNGNTGSTGGGANQNMPPAMVVNWMIRL